MHLTTPAIICALLAHGENGAVVRFLTPDHGLVAGYVHGGRSRRLRPVLQAGNGVDLRLDARTENQLAVASVELTSSRAALATTSVALAALDWLTALTATALSESVPHPALYTALDALTAAIAAGAGALPLGEGIVRYELLMLTELGFGLDLSVCALTGTTDDLAFASPRTGRAVCRAAAEPYRGRLLTLPAFLVGPATADNAEIVEGLRLSRHFLERHVLQGRHELVVARRRLADRWR